MKVYIPVYKNSIGSIDPDVPYMFRIDDISPNRMFSTKEKAQAYCDEEDAKTVEINARFNARRIKEHNNNLTVKSLLEDFGFSEEDIQTYVYVQSEKQFQQSLVMSGRIWHIWEVEVD